MLKRPLGNSTNNRMYAPPADDHTNDSTHDRTYTSTNNNDNRDNRENKENKDNKGSREIQQDRERENRAKEKKNNTDRGNADIYSREQRGAVNFDKNHTSNNAGFKRNDRNDAISRHEREGRGRPRTDTGASALKGSAPDAKVKLWLLL